MTGQTQDQYLIDWAAVEDEALTYFTELLRINTTNPPGNETAIATYLRDELAEDGIEGRLYALEPGRDNLVARISGNGSKLPVLVMGHTDVVGVQRENWSVEPFDAVRRDGYIYGRGSLDDKDSVTAGLMILLMLKRYQVELDRDVIFLAEAGEEGTPYLGIDFMVNEHWNEIDSQYCLAEGGGAIAQDGEVRYVSIATAEKFPMRVQLVAHGTAGHGSAPRADNAIAALSAAVAKLSAWQPPMRLNQTTEAYFERLASISSDEDAMRYRGILDPERQARIQQYFALNDPRHYSILRTGISPTIISGGFRRNVIPASAEATLDIRALPDENPEDFYDDMAAVINDPNVEIIPEGIYRPPGQPSPIDNEMFQVIESVNTRLFPESVTLPTMSAGSSDKAQMRAAGVPCYGFGPVLNEEDLGTGGGAHGDDERIPEDSLLKLIQFLWYTIIGIAATTP
ncbi:MAG: peptidase M20 [Rhodospirillaceae bacterium]|nr:peptidase M20 [Rhodospirillaceae bacterium]|tara:strand:- start:3083 stop:4450 length:1368 start_codon:yes stop_codon:yes gene_type:complete